MRATGCTMGVDLGGQSVKLAVVDAAGAILLRRHAPIDAALPAAQLTQQIVAEIGALLDQARASSLIPDSVGMVMPGYMDRDRTRLLFAANLPTLSGSTVLADIARAVGLPLVFDADCNAAALAEFRYGAGRDAERLIVATVGTGIGAGVIIDGQIVRLRNHIAGSLGHVIVNPKGPRCACGARGCVEAVASGRAIERRTSELARDEPGSYLAGRLAQHGQLTGKDITEALAAGDAAASRAVSECGGWLGVAIATWCAIYAPGKVLIGGGMVALGEPLLSAVRAGFREVGPPAVTQETIIAPAALGPDAGVIGAAAMAAER